MINRPPINVQAFLQEEEIFYDARSQLKLLKMIFSF